MAKTITHGVRRKTATLLPLQKLNKTPTNLDEVRIDTLSYSTASADLPDPLKILTWRYVGQIDHKFLFATRDTDFSSPTTTAVLLDQHAADERVRVEGLLSSLCATAPAIHYFPTPVQIILHRKHVEHLSQFRSRLEHLGFQFRESADALRGVHGGWLQISVHAVPAVLAVKLKHQNELQSTFRQCLAFYGQQDSPYKSEEGPSVGVFGWLNQIRFIPHCLVELANSQACRSAIFFQDMLTPEEGQRLLASLSTTAFPNLCAHGRPSQSAVCLVPKASPECRRLQWAKFLRS